MQLNNLSQIQQNSDRTNLNVLSTSTILDNFTIIIIIERVLLKCLKLLQMYLHST